MPRLDSPKACPPPQAPTPRPPTEHGEDIGVKPLAAIRETFEAREVDRISSRNLLDALRKLAGDEPWAVWWKGDLAKNNTRGPAAKLAHYLKPLGIAPGTIREPDGSTPKGYKLESFEDAFSRYLPPKPLLTPHRHKAHE